MARKKRMTIKTIAKTLVKGKSLAYQLRKDGALIVIGPEGRKLHFSAAQVQSARESESGAESKENVSEVSQP